MVGLGLLLKSGENSSSMARVGHEVDDLTYHVLPYLNFTYPTSMCKEQPLRTPVGSTSTASTAKTAQWPANDRDTAGKVADAAEGGTFASAMAKERAKMGGSTGPNSLANDSADNVAEDSAGGIPQSATPVHPSPLAPNSSGLGDWSTLALAYWP